MGCFTVERLALTSLVLVTTSLAARRKNYNNQEMVIAIQKYIEGNLNTRLLNVILIPKGGKAKQYNP